MISCNNLQRSIESNLDYDVIPAHLKKQIHKIMDEWFCSCAHSKVMIIEHIYTFTELDVLSKLLKEVIAESSRL